MLTQRKSIKTKIVIFFVGIFIFLVLFEILLRIGGFLWLSSREKQNRLSGGDLNVYTIMCIGESTTAIAGDSTNKFLIDGTSYPRQLERILNEGNGVRYKVINKGIVAGDSGQILEELESNLERYKPDMVMAMMGLRDENKVVKDSLLRQMRVYKYIKSLSENVPPGELLRRVERKIIELLYKPYLEERKYEEAEKMLKKLLAINLKSAYAELAKLYIQQKRYLEAEAMLKKAIEEEPKKYILYLALARLYRQEGRFVEEEELYRSAITTNKRFGGYLKLATYYKNKGRQKEFEEVLRVAVETTPSVRQNYQRLEEILSSKGITLVVMQYPSYSADCLKALLHLQDNLIIIDNEKIFDSGTYNEFYFETADFAFPHYTEKGARALARNIAERLKEKYFNHR